MEQHARRYNILHAVTTTAIAVALAVFAVDSKNRFDTLAANHASLLQRYAVMGKQAETDRTRLEAALATLELQTKQIQKQVNPLADRFTKTDENAAKALSGIESLTPQLQDVQRRAEEEKHRLDDTRRAAADIASAIDFLVTRDAPAEKSAAKPVTFSALAPVKHLGGFMFDGDGGRDTFNGNDRELTLDGTHLLSVERIMIANGVAQHITVLAPGLLDLEDGWMEIDTDKSLDAVTLDGCLSWKKDNRKKGDTAEIWHATDAALATRKLTITGGATVSVEKTCDNRYDLRAGLREYPLLWHEKSQRLRNSLLSSAGGAPAQNRREAALHEKLSSAQRKEISMAQAKEIFLPHYRLWRDTMTDERMKSVFAVVVDLIEKDALPPYFLTQGHMAVPLLFDPAVQKPKSEKDAGCSSGLRNLPPIGIQSAKNALDGAPNGVQGACGGIDGGIIFSGRGDDVLQLDSSRTNFVAPGGGTDMIAIKNAPGIVFLERGWGFKKITTTCANNTGTDVYMDMSIPEVFAGVGLPLGWKDGKPVVAGMPFPRSPAAASTIRPGDRILAVDDKSVDGLAVEDIGKLIRGAAGTKVKLTYADASGSSITLELVRAEINHDPRKLTRSLVQLTDTWPFRYNNFMVFGTGIARADIVEDAPGHWKNTKTGDKFELPACFNFVFADEAAKMTATPIR